MNWIPQKKKLKEKQLKENIWIKQKKNDESNILKSLNFLVTWTSLGYIVHCEYYCLLKYKINLEYVFYCVQRFFFEKKNWLR